MEDEARASQNEIQVVHEERRLDVHEPLYGLAPEPGGGGPASVGDASQPRVEVPVEEPPRPGEDRINMTWGIVFGGVLILLVLAAVLYLGLGNNYVTSGLSTYPVK